MGQVIDYVERFSVAVRGQFIHSTQSLVSFFVISVDELPMKVTYCCLMVVALGRCEEIHWGIVAGAFDI